MNVPDIRTPLGHRLTPSQMIETTRLALEGGHGVKLGEGLIEGLLDLILLLPLDELTALRAEYAPAPTLEEAA